MTFRMVIAFFSLNAIKLNDHFERYEDVSHVFSRLKYFNRNKLCNDYTIRLYMYICKKKKKIKLIT